MDDLQGFLAALERDGELLRVSAPVSPILEIAEIADRQSKLPCARPSHHAGEFDPEHADRGGHALLFENVQGTDFPLCINVFGSYRRAEMALRCHEAGGFEAIAARIAALTKPQPPASLRDLLGKVRELLPLLRVPPRRVRRGRCQEVVKLAARGEVDLTRLPLIRCWPMDGDPAAVGFGMTAEQAGTAAGGGRYLTFAGIHTIHAEDAGKERPPSHNIGMYRVQLIDRTRMVMHWHMHHDGAAHWRSWKARGEPMPVAICLGGEPVLPYAATAPLPPGLSELLLAGFLHGRGIPLVPARTVPLRVPANSEIVLEGWVSTECGPIGYDPREPLGPGAVLEGPFGDHTGFYSLPDRYPVLEVTAITHRRNAVYPTTIVGLPPQEDYYLGKATERVFLPLLKTLIHDIADYHLPQFGCFHNCAFVQIHKAYPLQARRVMHAIWGAGQMAWTKLLVVVDQDVDVHHEEAVLRALFEHCHFGRDLELVNGPLDILDHAAPRLGAGHKLGFDATRKLPGEEVNGVPLSAPTRRGRQAEARSVAAALPGRSTITAATVPDYADGRALVIAVDKRHPTQAAIQSALQAAAESPIDLIIAVDATVDVQDRDQVWFHVCSNVDPGRDLVRQDQRAVVDATTKVPRSAHEGIHPVRAFPPLIQMDPEVQDLVKRRWDEYFTTQ